jgi:hypothetical protein
MGEEMKLDNFIVDKIKNTITWDLNGYQITVSCENLDSAHIFTKNNLILALAGPGNFPSRLIGLSEDGNEIFSVEAPAGFVFSYLLEHPTVGIAVVCGGDNQIDGWYDWYFSVNPSTGGLTRSCPAY